MPDVNVWIALAAARHVHYELANAWLDGVSAEEIAFCRVSELGFLRLLTNPHVMGKDARDSAEAWRVYDGVREDSRVTFLHESVGFQGHWRRVGEQIRGGPNAWTDAYLAALAAYEKVTVVTFDRDFQPVGDCHVVTLGRNPQDA